MANNWRILGKGVKYMYTFCGKQICRSAFQIVYDVKEHTFDSLQKHVQTNGIIPRNHSNKGRKAPHSFTFNEVRYATNNLLNYATRNGFPHPTGSRGGNPDPPVTMFRQKRWNPQACRKNGIRVLSLSSFKGVWLNCTPHIKVSTTRSDVCFLSEKQSNTIREPVTDAEKLDVTVNFPQKHSDCRAEEKQKNCERFDHGTSRSRQRIWAFRSLLKVTHKSSLYFWFLTANWLFCLMGPLYFLVHITWVRENGLPRQYMYNYLVDESQTIQGKLIRLISRGGRIQRGRKVPPPLSNFLFISYCMHVEDWLPSPDPSKKSNYGLNILTSGKISLIRPC